MGLNVSFNPRARVGRDFSASICALYFACFNPRARVGRDAISAPISAISAMFQSTRPRGARHLGQEIIRASIFGFNPRARVGRDISAIAPIP